MAMIKASKQKKFWAFPVTPAKTSFLTQFPLNIFFSMTFSNMEIISVLWKWVLLNFFRNTLLLRLVGEPWLWWGAESGGQGLGLGAWRESQSRNSRSKAPSPRLPQPLYTENLWQQVVQFWETKFRLYQFSKQKSLNAMQGWGWEDCVELFRSSQPSTATHSHKRARLTSFTMETSQFAIWCGRNFPNWILS